MKYIIDKSVKGKAKFTFTVSREEWNNEIEAAYQKTKSKFRVQGFRPGHVPRKIVEKHYGEMVFFDDAFNDMFIKQYSEAVQNETDLEPVGQPEIDITDMSSGIIYTAVVELKPEIVAKNYTGNVVKKIERLVTDEEVDAEITKAREKAGREITVTDRGVVDGDTAKIDYSGSVDGKKFEGGTATGHELKIGSNTFIPGFEPQLVGMKIGEEKDITVTFPDDYRETSLAGKDAIFAIKLHEIKSIELPELDDAFAKDISEFDTLKDYKDDVRKTLQARYDEQADAEMENALIDKIVAQNEFDIPAAMIESQIDRKIQEIEYRLMYQGMQLDEYLKMMGMTRDDIRKDYQESSKKTVRTRLVLESIVKQEKIDATDKEVEERIKENAKNAKKSEKEYKDSMPKQETDYIKNDIITKKLSEFLKANNKYDENAPETKLVKKTEAKPKAATSKMTAAPKAATAKTETAKTATAKTDKTATTKAATTKSTAKTTKPE